MPEAFSNSKRLTLFERMREFLSARDSRIYILPTWYCILFNTAVVALLIGSFPLRSFSLFGLSVFLLFIQLLSMVETHVNLRELKVALNQELIVEANSSAVLSLDASSLDKTFSVDFRALELNEFDNKGHVKLSSRAVRSIVFGELRVAFFRSIDAVDSKFANLYNIGRDPQSLQLPFSAQRRGVHKIPPVLISSFFPFGLFRAFKIIDFKESYVAYPVPRNANQIQNGISDKSVMVEMTKAASAKFLIGADDYSHHREFKMGDALQRVDWKASSRRGGKIIKVFASEDGGRGQVFRWQDTLSKEKEGKLSELCHNVLEAAKNGQKYGLELPNLKTAVHSGERHRLDCLRALAGFDLTRTEHDVRLS